MDNLRNEGMETGTGRQQASSATSPKPSRRSVLHQWFHRFINTVYFESITLIHPERLPRLGPVIYLGLHRNGAVDGFVYDQVLHHPVFMISTQLRKNWFARLFFEGIAVSRTKDEGIARSTMRRYASVSTICELAVIFSSFPKEQAHLGRAIYLSRAERFGCC